MHSLFLWYHFSMNEKKVVIIGAGIAGLAAGIYAKKSGFDVTILEKHIIPGGLSTSWSRKGYLFEGGMHWLTGSSEKLTLNKIWKELGALKENNPVFYKDPISTLVDKNEQINLFRDIDKLREEFLRIAPEDKKAINQLYKDTKLFLPVHLVVNDIAGLKTDEHRHPKISELLKMLPVLTRYKALVDQSYEDYIQQFSNKNIKHLLRSVIGERYNAISFVYTIASFASGDCGYPEGGSLRMSKNMADTFESIGGKIKYHANAEKVVIENKKTKGVIVNGEFMAADAVIVTQDARKAIDTLFETELKEKWVPKMRRAIVSEQNIFIGLGVKADLSKYPRSVIFPLEKPFNAGGVEYKEFRINNYALYKNHSPEGCTTLTVLFLGKSYAYWKAAKEDGSYKQKKQELAEAFIAELEKFIPEIKGNIEVYDVATPVTYERYCNTFEGSWMSVWEPGKPSFAFPAKSKTVSGLYFAGQRSTMPGGLPIVVYSGRIAAQYLCRDNHVMFRN